eukprot:14229648-Heterocapsa_arctica.AAC.1
MPFSRAATAFMSVAMFSFTFLYDSSSSSLRSSKLTSRTLPLSPCGGTGPAGWPAGPERPPRAALRASRASSSSIAILVPAVRDKRVSQ